MALLHWPNLAQTTLTATCNIGAASITVSSPAAFGAAPFYIRVEHATAGAPDSTQVEFMKVTAVAGSVFTVTKGQGGTSDQAHAIGDFVTAVIIDQSLSEGLVQQVTAQSGGTTIFTPSGGQGVVQFNDAPTYGGVITGSVGLRDGRGFAGANVPAKLDESVLGAGAASVTFSSISSAYRNLRIVLTAKGDTAATYIVVNLFFNGDTAASYVVQQIQGNNNVVASTQSAAFTASPNIAYITAASGTANSPGSATIEIPNYSGTTFVKVAQSQYMTMGADSLASEVIGQYGLRWNSTAAITSIKLQPTTGNFITGSVFSLYGF